MKHGTIHYWPTVVFVIFKRLCGDLRTSTSRTTKTHVRTDMARNTRSAIQDEFFVEVN